MQPRAKLKTPLITKRMARFLIWLKLPVAVEPRIALLQEKP